MTGETECLICGRLLGLIRCVTIQRRLVNSPQDDIHGSNTRTRVGYSTHHLLVRYLKTAPVGVLLVGTSIEDFMANQQIIIRIGGIDGDLVKAAIIFHGRISKPGIFSGLLITSISVEIIPDFFSLHAWSVFSQRGEGTDVFIITNGG